MQYFCTDLLSLGSNSQEEILFFRSISGFTYISLGEIHHTFVTGTSSCCTWSSSQEAPQSGWVFVSCTQKFTLSAVWFYHLWLIHKIRCPPPTTAENIASDLRFLYEILCHQTLPWSLITATWFLYPQFCLFIASCKWHHLICVLWPGLLSLSKMHLKHLGGCEDKSTEQYYCPL